MATLFLDKSWKQFKKAIDPKYAGPVLKKHVGRATSANGAAVRRRIRQHIKAGAPTREGHVGNAPLTALIKGGDKPIVGTKGADLFNSITYKAYNWRTVYVGAHRMGDGVNIAEIVHNGRIIKVTQAMRGMFWLLWLAAKGRVNPGQLAGRAMYLWLQAGPRAKDFKPISKGKTHIVIPSRPFIKDVLEQDETRMILDTNWTNAMAATLKELAAKGAKV